LVTAFIVMQTLTSF